MPAEPVRESVGAANAIESDKSVDRSKDGMHSRRTAFQKRSLARLTLAAGSPVQVVAGSQTYENKKCSDPESPAMQRERDDEHACRDPRPANVDVPQEAHIPILGLQVPTWGTRPHRRQAVWARSP